MPTQLHPITYSRLVQVLRTAWKIDKYQDYRKVRKDISACKVEVARVTREIALRTLQVRSTFSLPLRPCGWGWAELACGQIHGSLGASWELPFAGYLMQGVTYGASTDQPPLDSSHLAQTNDRPGIADGPSEVHKPVVAKQVLANYAAVDDLFPTRHIPKLRAAAIAKYKPTLEKLGLLPELVKVEASL